jgi:hypothetical protein
LDGIEKKSFVLVRSAEAGAGSSESGDDLLTWRIQKSLYFKAVDGDNDFWGHPRGCTDSAMNRSAIEKSRQRSGYRHNTNSQG